MCIYVCDNVFVHRLYILVGIIYGAMRVKELLYVAAAASIATHYRAERHSMPIHRFILNAHKCWFNINNRVICLKYLILQLSHHISHTHALTFTALTDQHPGLRPSLSRSRVCSMSVQFYWLVHATHCICTRFEANTQSGHHFRHLVYVYLISSSFDICILNFSRCICKILSQYMISIYLNCSVASTPTVHSFCYIWESF